MASKTQADDALSEAFGYYIASAQPQQDYCLDPHSQMMLSDLSNADLMAALSLYGQRETPFLEQGQYSESVSSISFDFSINPSPAPLDDSQVDTRLTKNQIPLAELSDQQQRQERRKAQNRAAQRAFRLRKDELFRRLQSKLRLTAEEVAKLQRENEELTRLIQLFEDENTALRARRDHGAWPNGARPTANAQGNQQGQSPWEGCAEMVD